MLHCWRGTGHFFVPTPGDLTAQESPPPGICHPRQKKKLMPGGGGAGGIDWCLILLYSRQKKYPFRIPSTDKFYHFHLPVSWNMKNTSQNQNISSQVPPLFHSYKIHLVSPLGPFSRPKCQISIPLPFHHQLVKSYPFHIPDACLKKVPFRKEPSRIGHFREYPPRVKLGWAPGNTFK